MRYTVEPTGHRFSVVDTKYDVDICHTGKRESAQKIADEYNAKYADAPEPTTFIEFAERRKQDLLNGERSFEKNLPQQDSLMLRRATRGESYRLDDVA